MPPGFSCYLIVEDEQRSSALNTTTHSCNSLQRRVRGGAENAETQTDRPCYPSLSYQTELATKRRGGVPQKFANLFANGLKGALLICHGMVDTNVNFQDSVRLVEKLIELRKENWQVAPYPVEDHGFEREESWADEYKRIYKLFEDNLRPGTLARTTSKSTSRNSKKQTSNSGQ